MFDVTMLAWQLQLDTVIVQTGQHFVSEIHMNTNMMEYKESHKKYIGEFVHVLSRHSEG